MNPLAIIALILGGTALVIKPRRQNTILPPPSQPPSSTGERNLLFGPPHPGFGVITPEEREARFGPVRFQEKADGSIQIISAPQTVPVQTFALPGTPQIVNLNPEAAPGAQAAFEELRDRGIPIRDVGSIAFRKARGKNFLSSHAYGLAIDINAGDNPQGSLPTQEMGEIAKAFVKHGGWYWGGWFSNPDPHHLEFTGQNTLDVPRS